jgi:hypothetical protein
MLEQHHDAASGITAGEFQTMQLTLVSHYGKKPPALERLLRELQDLLSGTLGQGFHPYALEQVHGTIIGLEGSRIGDQIRGANFWRLRGREHWIDFRGLLAFLRSPSFSTFSVQIGNFRSDEDYPFTSQGQPPYVRSFSIQKEIAVTIAWPRLGEGFPATLDSLRLRFQTFGALHKWHAQPQAADNDFFFVLGRVGAGVTEAARREAEALARRWLSAAEPVMIPITRESLSFVAYTDPRLPFEGSRALRLADESVTAPILESLYD